jgi:hypothetical protein
MRRALLFVFFATAASLQAQNLRSPADLFKIIEKSVKTYAIEELKTPIALPDRSGNIVLPGFYKKTDPNGSFSILQYSPNPESKAFFDKAEAFFAKEEMDSAMVYYQRSYDADNAYLQPLVYIGQINGIRKNNAAAIASYTKVLEKNPIDYMAHWFLADILNRENETDKALQEIVLAHILNRNNKRIHAAVERILKPAGLTWNDWAFNPQYQLEGEGNTIALRYTGVWLGYAIGKAVQRYEDKQPEDGRQEDVVGKEKECIIGLAIGLTGDDVKKQVKDEFALLTKAIDKKMIDEFILYEIILPQYPQVARQLPQALLNNIRNYLIQVKFAQ